MAGELSGRFTATALFVDIVGFTATTNALLQHGQHGAEVMAELMRQVFDPLVAIVQSYGGFISGFGGDSFIALFEQEAVLPAVAAAFNIQKAFAEQGQHQTVYGLFPFTGRIGLAVGLVEWGILLPAGALTHENDTGAYYFRGPAIDDCSAAKQIAGRGEVVATQPLYEQVKNSLPTQAVGDFWRLFPAGTLPKAHIVRPEPTPIPAQIQARFIPPAIRHQQENGEYRRVVTLYLQLQWLETAAQLDQFVHLVFHLRHLYGGYLHTVSFNDRGCNLVLLWGTPTSYENDVQRAIEFALELSKQSQNPIRAGLTSRLMYAGYIGATGRREYGGYGQGVNLACRLMENAPWEAIWLDEQMAQKANVGYELDFEGQWAFKGFVQKEGVYRLRGRRTIQLTPDYLSPFIGRQAELAQLQQFTRPVLMGQFAGVMLIIGEAGIGKTRLVRQLRHWLTQEREIYWLQGTTDQTHQQTDLFPFRNWLRDHYFQLESNLTVKQRRQKFSNRFKQLCQQASRKGLKAELKRTRSFLEALVNIHRPGSPYAQADSKDRQQHLLAALIALLQAESLHRPLILHLEDAHWLDELSCRLLRQLEQAAIDYPIGIVITIRPEATDIPFQAQTSYQILYLEPLSESELGQMVANQSQTPVQPNLAAALYKHSGGNPLFAEQLLQYLQQQKEQNPFDKIEQFLPADLLALLTARIDGLPPAVKEIVQRAAILGDEFDVGLLSKLADQNGQSQNWIQQASQAGIWFCKQANQYLFSHALLRHAAYNMQLQARRVRLHGQAAELIKQSHPNDLAAYYNELVYHYFHAQRPAEERQYRLLAADQAAHHFVMQDALVHLDRALELTPAGDPLGQFDVRQRRETIYSHLGREKERQQDLDKLKELADQLLADNQIDPLIAAAHKAQSAIRTIIGTEERLDRPVLLSTLQTATTYAQIAHDQALEAETNRLRGVFYLNQGEYTPAQKQMEMALALFRQANDPAGESKTLRDLGNVYWSLHESSIAWGYYQRALTLCREIGDRTIESMLLNDMAGNYALQGDYAQALHYLEQGLALKRELGHKSGVGILLGNIGAIYDQVGLYEKAERCYLEALTIARQTEQKNHEAFVLAYLTLLYHHLGHNNQAYDYAQTAGRLLPTLNRRWLVGIILTFTAHVLVGLEQLPSAESQYEQAIKIWDELQNQANKADAMGGLAMVWLAQNQPEKAQTIADWIIEYILDNPEMAGCEEPMQVCWNCYQILKLSRPGHANWLLKKATNLLHQRAGRISDPTLRDSYLHQVPAHRAILLLDIE